MISHLVHLLWVKGIYDFHLRRNILLHNTICRFKNWKSVPAKNKSLKETVEAWAWDAYEKSHLKYYIVEKERVRKFRQIGKGREGMI